MFASVGKDRTEQTVLHLGPDGSVSHIPPTSHTPGAGQWPAPTPPECGDGTLPIHQVLFTVLAEKPQNLLSTLHNLRAPTLLGQELYWLYPHWATWNLAQASQALQEPCTLSTPRGEYLFWVLHLQSLGVWLQDQDEVTKFVG